MSAESSETAGGMERGAYARPGGARWEAWAEGDGAQAWCPTRPGELREALADARAQGVTLHPMGSGRHVRALPSGEAVMLDLRGMSAISEWDGVSRVVVAQAGVTLGALEAYVAGQGGALSGWRREHPEATVGGVLSRYQPIPVALWGGSVREACLGLEAAVVEGSWYRYLPAPRKASGPDLRHLFVGGEGAFGVIAGAALAVSAEPERLAAWEVEGVAPEVALRALRDAFAHGFRAPNVLYSGAAQRLQVILEGSQAWVALMQAALERALERSGAGALSAIDPSSAYRPEQGDVRAGADPLSGRAEAAGGGLAVWGGLAELAQLPSEVWSQGVLFDVAAHQASVWFPAGSEAEAALGGGLVAQQRAVWWSRDGGVAAQVGGGWMARGIEAIKARLDPDGTLPSPWPDVLDLP